MKEITKMGASLNKKVLAGILALIMVFTACFNGYVRKALAATEAEITTYDFAEASGQNSMTVPYAAETYGYQIGEGIGTNSSIIMKVDMGAANEGAAYSLGLCKSTGTDMWDGQGYYFYINVQWSFLSFYVGGNEIEDSNVTLPTEPYVLEYGMVDITNDAGETTARRIFLKINDNEVYTYTDSTMSVSLGEYWSVYRTSGLESLTLSTTLVEATVTTYDFAEASGQNSMTVPYAGSTYGYQIGEGIGTNSSIIMKVDMGAANEGAAYSLGLCKSTGTDMWDGQGYYFEINVQWSFLSFYVGGNKIEDSNVTLPTEPYVLEYGITDVTNDSGETTARRIFLKINDNEVYTYTDSTMSVSLGEYWSVYRTSGLESLTLSTTLVEATVTTYDFAEASGQNSMTVPCDGSTYGYQIGEGIGTNSSIIMKVDTGAANEGAAYSLGLCKSTGTDMWDGQGYYFEINVQWKFLSFYVGGNKIEDSNVTLPTEPYVLEYGTVDITNDAGETTARRIFLKINDNEVYTYTDSTMSVNLGGYWSVYRTSGLESLTLSTTVSEATPTQYDFYDLMNQAVLTITEHSDAIGNRWGQPLGTGLTENMSVKMKVDTGTATSGTYSLGLCRSTGTDFWDGVGYYFEIDLTGKVAFFKGNDWAGQKDVTIPTGEPYILEYGIVNITDGTNTVTAKRIFIKINEEEVYSYIDSEMSVTCGDQLSAYTNVFPLTLFTTKYNQIGEKVPEDVVFEDIGSATAKSIIEVPIKEFGCNLGEVNSEQTGFAFKVNVPETTTESLFVGLYNTSSGDSWANGYILDIAATAEAGQLGFKIRKGLDHTELYNLGTLQGLGEDEITVHAWMKDNILYVAINGTIWLTHTNDGSIAVGNFMSAYNDWSHSGIIKEMEMTFAVEQINSKTAFDITNNQWKIYLNTTDSIPANSYNWKITVDGTSYDTTLVKEADNTGTLVYFTIPASVIPQNPDKHREVILTAMTSEALEDTWGNYEISLVDSYTLYVQKSGNVLDTKLDYVVDTGVAGDANGDNVSNSKDLVRMKKYVAGKLLVNGDANLTNIVGSEVNDEDIRALRRLLTLSDTEKKNDAGEYVNSAQDVDSYIAYGMPSYDKNEQMRIGAYCGPRAAGGTNYSITLDKTNDYWGYATFTADSITGDLVDQDFVNEYEFELFKNAGFNAMVVEDDASYSSSTGAKSQIEKYLDLAQTYGIDVVMQASKVGGYLNVAEGAATQDETEQEVAELIRLFSKYESFAGIQMGDEIPVTDGTNGTIVAERYAALTTFIQQDLGKDNLLLYSSNPAGTEDDGLSTRMETVGKVNQAYEFSIYPLGLKWKTLYNGTEATLDNAYENAFYNDRWFNYLSSAANAAKTADVNHLGIIMQSTGYIHPYGLYGDYDEPTSRRGIESQADVGYQAYTALAYGAKSMQYFTYWEHYRSNGNEFFMDSIVRYPEKDKGEDMTKSVLNKTANGEYIYDLVKAVNEDVQKFAYVLLDYEWKGTILLGKPQGQYGTLTDTSYTVDSNSRLNAATYSGGAAIVGCMKDSEGFDGYMIANASSPDEQESSTVTLTFNKASQVMVCDFANSDEVQIVDIENGVYECTVGAGEGIFVIPLV